MSDYQDSAEVEEDGSFYFEFPGGKKALNNFNTNRDGDLMITSIPFFIQ